MTTRQTILRDPRNPALDVLPTGFDPGNTSPPDFVLPSCGISDVDEAVFDLFDKELGFSTQEYNVNGKENKQALKKPSVIFSTGERFAIAKRLRPLRDQNKAMMLPSISIHRPNLQQTSEDIMGRGRNQMTGEFTIKRRLDSSDRDYQSLVNKLFLKNVPSPLDSRRPHGESLSDPAIKEGMLLEPMLGNNVYEIITIPTPQFYTVNYEVVFWTTYMEHMNYMIETLFASFLPQGKEFRVTCEKGYWFQAFVGDEFQSQDNIDDFTEEKRLIRYSFTMEVKAFMLAANGPGNAVPFRRHISAPTLAFDMVELPSDPELSLTEVKNRWKREDNSSNEFLLNDVTQPDPTQSTTTLEKFEIKKETVNPITGKKTIRYVKLSDQHRRKAESTYKASDPKTLQQFLFPDKRRGSE